MRSAPATTAIPFTIERVAGIRRDGFVMRTTRRAFGQDGQPEPLFRKTSNRFGEYLMPRVHYRSHLVIPAATVDVRALWAAWSERVGDWPGRESTNPAFRDLGEARSFVVGFRSVQDG